MDLKTGNSVLAAVGHGGLKEGQVVNKLVEEYNKVIKKAKTDREILEEIPEGKAKTYVSKSSSGIIVKGMRRFGSKIFTLLQSCSG